MQSNFWIPHKKIPLMKPQFLATNVECELTEIVTFAARRQQISVL